MVSFSTYPIISNSSIFTIAVKYLTRKSIVSKGLEYNLYLNDNTLSAFINNNLTSSTLPLGENINVLMTYDGNAQKLYINGNSVSSTNYSNTITLDSRDIILGSKFTGTINNFRLHNEVVPTNFSRWYDRY